MRRNKAWITNSRELLERNPQLFIVSFNDLPLTNLCLFNKNIETKQSTSQQKKYFLGSVEQEPFFRKVSRTHCSKLLFNAIDNSIALVRDHPKYLTQDIVFHKIDRPLKVIKVGWKNKLVPRDD